MHGYCGAKRSRLAWLAVLTFKASRSRVLTRKLLDELVGCWAFCLQFRRPLFSLIELMYNEGPVSKGHTEPFRPSQALRAEMQVLALLGMTAMPQLRTQVGPTMYATDASPDGAGAVSSTVEPGLAREIARRAECRGFHTRLLPPISAHLHEKGFVVDESLISSDFDLGHTQPPLDAGDPAPLLHKTAMFPVTSKIASMHDLADRMRQASARPQKGIGLNLMFDFIEIYSGSAILSREMIGKGLLVGPPIDIKSGWDMRKGNLFSLILGLALAGRIAILWLGPPATTYTHDRTPKRRSSVAPLGFDIFHLDVLGGNLHMHMSILLMAVQYKKGRIGVLETPWSAFSRKLKFWGWLLSLGCFEIRIDQSQFGTPYLKSTCLIATHEFVRAMGRRCRGGHKHVDLKGAATATASKYPVGLCKALASCLTQGARELFAILKSDGLWSSDDSLQHPQASPPPDQSRPRNLEYSRTSRKFVSHLWSVQLAEALVWKCCKKYTFKRQGHINLLEAHSRRSLLLNIPPRQRVITFQDSMVTLGAGAKGRRSSCALNKILKQEAMIQVAKELYVLGIHAPTWALRADDPSRGRSVRGPRAPFPLWWFKWMQGQVSEAQDLLDHASDTPRSLGRWFLLLSAAVLASSADFSSLRDWSQTLSMPSRQKRLRAGEGHPPNCHFTSSVVGGFSRMDPNSSARLARFEPAGQKPAGDFVCPELVEEFGRTLYEQGASWRTFAETVNALQQKFAFLKTWLHGSWALLTTWESLWPGQAHPPMPLMLLKAMVSTALAWGWKRVSLLLLVGFYGLLRPVEACLMKVTDFMTPADTGVPDILILQLHHVKSRTRGAKFQSVRLEEPHVITFIKKCFVSMSQDERLWPFSVNLFRTRFQQVLQATCHTPKLVFPSSLRPGGATYLFQVWGENLPKLQWRGRWIHVKTLTHYIQELGTINVLSQLTPPQKAKVRQLAELCEGALQDFKPCLDTQTLLHVAAKGLSQT